MDFDYFKSIQVALKRFEITITIIKVNDIFVNNP